MAFAFTFTCTTDHTTVPSDQPDLLWLFDETRDAFKSTGNGGAIMSDSAHDLCFYTDSDRSTLARWVLKSWDPSTGRVVAWINSGTQSASVDTATYGGAGDATITTFQGGNPFRTGTQLALVLGDGTTLDLTDHSGNAVALTNLGATAAPGAHGGEAAFADTAYATIGDGLELPPVSVYDEGTETLTFTRGRTIAAILTASALQSYVPLLLDNTRFAGLIWDGDHDAIVWTNGWGEGTSRFTTPTAPNTRYVVVLSWRDDPENPGLARIPFFVNGTAASSAGEDFSGSTDPLLLTVLASDGYGDPEFSTYFQGGIEAVLVEENDDPSASWSDDRIAAFTQAFRDPATFYTFAADEEAPDPTTGTPALASLALSAIAPSASPGSVAATPGVPSLTATVLTPTAVASGITVTPGVPVLTLAAPTPTAAPGAVVGAPSAPSATFSAVAPTAAPGGSSATPTIAALAVAVATPSAQSGSIRGTPALPSMTCTAPAPTAAGSVAVTPGIGSLALAALLPTGLSGSVTGVPTTPTLPLVAVAPSASPGAVSGVPGLAVLATTARDPSAILGAATGTPSVPVCGLEATTPSTGGSQTVTPVVGVLTTSAPTPSAALGASRGTPSVPGVVLLAAVPGAVSGMVVAAPAVATSLWSVLAPSAAPGGITTLPPLVLLTLTARAPSVLPGPALGTPAVPTLTLTGLMTVAVPGASIGVADLAVLTVVALTPTGLGATLQVLRQLGRGVLVHAGAHGAVVVTSARGTLPHAGAAGRIVR